MLLAEYRKEEDVDPEQIRKDIERLQLIKQKRSDCSLQVTLCMSQQATAGSIVTVMFKMH